MIWRRRYYIGVALVVGVCAIVVVRVAPNVWLAVAYSQLLEKDGARERLRATLLESQIATTHDGRASWVGYGRCFGLDEPLRIVRDGENVVVLVTFAESVVRIIVERPMLPVEHSQYVAEDLSLVAATLPGDYGRTMIVMSEGLRNDWLSWQRKFNSIGNKSVWDMLWLSRSAAKEYVLWAAMKIRTDAPDKYGQLIATDDVIARVYGDSGSTESVSRAELWWKKEDVRQVVTAVGPNAERRRAMLQAFVRGYVPDDSTFRIEGYPNRMDLHGGE